MTDRRQALLENLEEAKLALLLDDYADACARADLECYEQELRQGGIPEISEEEIREKYDAFIKKVEREENKVKRRRSLPLKLLRRVGAAAAIIAIFFSVLIAVQASGVDVFGAIGRWSDDFFSFNSNDSMEAEASTDKNLTDIVDEIRFALLQQSLPVELSPTWIPDGYSIIEVSSISTEIENSVTITLANEKEDWIMIKIGMVSTSPDMNTVYPKDATTPETYVSKDKCFYVYQNVEKWAAVWQYDQQSIFIIGCMTKEELHQILDSIGETVL